MDILTKHSKIVLITSVILFVVFFFQEKFIALKDIQTNSMTNIICLFLILTIGISHGALDHLKGQKILKVLKIENSLLFYIAYILLGSLIMILWFLFPTFTLVIFLIVACYHFGKEDSQFAINKKKAWHNLFFLCKGLLIIAAPLNFHNEETINIFRTLGAENYFLLKFEPDLIWQYHRILMWVAILGNLLFFYICVSKDENDIRWLYLSLDSMPVLILNFSFTPLMAFTFYFCFIHSFKHSVSLINKLDNKNFRAGTEKFIKKAAPLTITTSIIFLIGLAILTNYYVLNDAILKVIFIGLASLTFPHILLEYLIEKNER